MVGSHKFFVNFLYRRPYALLSDVQQSHTITHLCPVEDKNNRTFKIGFPVFMTGNVYYNENDQKWIPSTIENSTDCIPSVKTRGTRNEYLGVCVEIVNDKEIKFASHGDFLIKINSASKYKVGDTIVIDENGEYKVLDENETITTKILRSTVGIVTSIIDDSTLAIFKG
ncbi:hypothetical protein TRFO_05357 [Tritrichomonas foetus]|uniref:Uncharacterized protein n=1 Tax=Tritrichomonas foetus TaxID=1144522 RepID=A0A1J4K8B4_9EUKA|nr:hypothetical protein TRFO_05357 [Tritrichomonas foetus]|eukprot:OHT07120.1 hypothetical protein TRFO_05357 [Tritrichomonas foetus]